SCRATTSSTTRAGLPPKAKADTRALVSRTTLRLPRARGVPPPPHPPHSRLDLLDREGRSLERLPRHAKRRLQAFLRRQHGQDVLVGPHPARGPPHRLRRSVFRAGRSIDSPPSERQARVHLGRRL